MHCTLLFSSHIADGYMVGRRCWVGGICSMAKLNLVPSVVPVKTWYLSEPDEAVFWDDLSNHSSLNLSKFFQLKSWHYICTRQRFEISSSYQWIDLTELVGISQHCLYNAFFQVYWLQKYLHKTYILLALSRAHKLPSSYLMPFLLVNEALIPYKFLVPSSSSLEKAPCILPVAFFGDF